MHSISAIPADISLKSKTGHCAPARRHQMGPQVKIVGVPGTIMAASFLTLRGIPQTQGGDEQPRARQVPSPAMAREIVTPTLQSPAPEDSWWRKEVFYGVLVCRRCQSYNRV